MAVAKSLRAILLGSPVDPQHQVAAAELLAKLAEIELRTAVNLAPHFVDTLADLSDVPVPVTGATGFVLDDGDDSGVYRRGSSEWVKTSELPVAFSDAVSALAGLEIEAVARANGDAAAVQRSNHTGTQPISTVAGLQAALDAKPSLDEVSAVVAGGRPGQQMRAFVTAASGAPGGLTPIEGQEGISSATLAGLGQVARVDGTPAIIATREAQAVQRGRVYRVHAYVRRLADGADPAGNTVALQLARLDATYAQLGVITVDARILRVNDGLWHLTGTVALDPGALAGVDWSLAEGTVYVRPYVQVFTSDHQTAVAQIDVVDVTEAASIEGALDVLALAGAVETAQGEAAAAAADRAQAALARAAAELARNEAALYDGPKVDTDAELETVTPEMLPVGQQIRAIDTGAVYRSVDSGGDRDFSDVGGVRLRVVSEFVTPEMFRLAIEADWAVTINRALNSGASEVRCLGREYEITSKISPPNGVSLVCSDATWFKATAAGAGVEFVAGSTFGNRYGQHSRVKVDGAGIATLGIYVGLAVFAEFRQFQAKNCAIGAVIDAAQNNTIADWNVFENTLDMMVLNGAGNNKFSRVELSDAGAAAAGEASNLVVANDVSYPGFAYGLFGGGGPTGNTFDRCIFERSSETGTSVPVRVRIKHGRQNVFRDCDWGGSNMLCLVIDAGVTGTVIENPYMAGGGAAGSFAIENRGFRSRLIGGLYENFADNGVIKTYNQLIFSDLSFGSAAYYVQNMSGSARANLLNGKAAGHLGTSDISAISTTLLYPGVPYYNDSNKLWFRGNGQNLEVVTGDSVTATVNHPAAAVGDRVLTLQLPSAGMWDLFVTTFNSDRNHSRSARYTVVFDAGGSLNDINDIQQIGTDAAHGTIIDALTTTVSVSGLITATANCNNAGGTVNMRIRAVRVGSMA